jgi:SAM-dependent methyltransferase
MAGSAGRQQGELKLDCVICSQNSWRSLPVPTPARSVTTSGIIIPEPLEREQFMSCGLLRKKDQRFLGHGDFYEEQYQNYYERPNVEYFDRGRYIAMAEWMKSALGPEFSPRSILDIGCGAGWSMQATRNIYGSATIAGIEPSIANAQKARSSGFEVSSGRFGSASSLPGPFDLIYCQNVLQHITDVRGFFRDLAANLAANGRILMILPDATDASNEMLWCDHNFSFRPHDLLTLAESVNLRVCNWQPNPPNNTLLNKQLIVLTNAGPGVHFSLPERGLAGEALFERRSAYMAGWQKLDRELARRAAGHARIFNFGASMWTWLLAGYCPAYWSSVTACLVDGASGRCMDKPVISPSEVQFSARDCIALGVNPVNQASFEQRLRTLGVDVVSWADMISS